MALDVWQESRDHYSFGFYRASRAQIEGMVSQVKARESGYYSETDQYLYRALADGTQVIIKKRRPVSV